MILGTITRSIQILLAGAVTTNQLKVVANWVDMTAEDTTGGSTPSTTNGTTAITAVSAPAVSTVRKVSSLSVFNADTVSATVTVRFNDNGTFYPLVVVALPAGSTLFWTDVEGWKVISASGSLQMGMVGATGPAGSNGGAGPAGPAGAQGDAGISTAGVLARFRTEGFGMGLNYSPGEVAFVITADVIAYYLAIWPETFVGVDPAADTDPPHWLPLAGVPVALATAREYGGGPELDPRTFHAQTAVHQVDSSVLTGGQATGGYVEVNYGGLGTYQVDHDETDVSLQAKFDAGPAPGALIASFAEGGPLVFVITSDGMFYLPVPTVTSFLTGPGTYDAVLTVNQPGISGGMQLAAGSTDTTTLTGRQFVKFGFGGADWREVVDGVDGAAGPSAIANVTRRTTALTSDALVLDDVGKEIATTATTAVALLVEANATVPCAAGDIVYVRQLGTGAVTLTPDAGVTLNAPAGGTLVSAGVGGALALKYAGSDVWDVYGQTVPA